jgi:DNA-binding MarR family transcriptional regulator
MTEAVTDVGAAGADGAEDGAVRLAAAIGQLIRLLRRQAPAEVGPGSLAVLATLCRYGPLRLGELAAREGVAPPTLTRMVGALAEAGYVTRRPDDDDRRAARVSVTPAGARVVAGAQAARAAVLRSRLAALPADDARALRMALPALEALAAADKHP